MLLLTEPFGQKSNVFFQHIHLDSFCRANNIFFCNPHLRKYNDNYPNLKTLGNFSLVKSLLPLSRWLVKAGIIPNTSFDDESASLEYQQLLLKNPVFMTCSGWGFRSFQTTMRYRILYKNLFKPDIDGHSLEKTILNKVDEAQVLIGLHIRRTDYKTFLGGKYYYDDSVYLQKLNELLSILMTTHYKIITVTDDKDLNINVFENEFHNIVFSGNNDVIDQYILSKCDYILGPPSTFSLWASYMGESLYCHIEDPTTSLRLSDFKICNG